MSAEAPEHTVVIHVAPGEVLDGRWRLETRVGQGAMGSVFRGRDLTTNELVAVKILAPEHCRKPKVVARFEREAGQLTRLRHPNLVAFHGHGRRGVLPFIVMEFLDGLTLSEVLERHGPRIGLAETVAIVKQIAAGLSFLHSQGLVHRDIKPQNVFLASRGRVTILDLGVVRDVANPGLTRPGAMVGTPYYMSPEQILGVEDIDQRTDVYALAAVTFELLTGRPPYLGNNNFEVLYGHKNSPPPSATELVPSVPARVSQVIVRGLAKRREERSGDVLHFIADLEANAGVRKIDLAQAFDVSHPERTRVTRGTRTAAKAPPPPLATDSVPEAANSDIRSVPAAREEEEQHTVVLRLDDAPRAEPEPPPASAPEPPPAPPVEAPPPPNAGQLRVVVTARGRAESANIFVAGRPQGTSPRTLTLSAGPHQVRIELAGYLTVERWAVVTPGGAANLRVFLEKSPGPGA